MASIPLLHASSLRTGLRKLEFVCAVKFNLNDEDFQLLVLLGCQKLPAAAEGCAKLGPQDLLYGCCKEGHFSSSPVKVRLLQSGEKGATEWGFKRVFCG